MKHLMTETRLREENRVFVGTGGVSEANRCHGFVPAFYDLASGRAEIARFADGRPAPMHLLEGLPEEWIVQRDAAGGVSAIKSTVIAGFIRDDYFYTRDQAAAAVLMH